jgi:hypothetical protein
VEDRPRVVPGTRSNASPSLRIIGTAEPFPVQAAGGAVAGTDSVPLLSSLERIREMASLPADWDADGAESPTAVSVATACYLIEAVAWVQERQGHGRVAPTTSSPIPDGGLNVEWDGPDARAAIQANPDGTLGYLIRWGLGPDGRYEEADEASLETVLGLISRALAS